MSSQELRGILDRAITRSNEINGSYRSGCMNMAIAIREICMKRLDIDPDIIGIERPDKIGYDYYEHFVVVLGGKCYINEYHDLEGFAEKDSTFYVDKKGVHDSLESILTKMYRKFDVKESKNSDVEAAGIFFVKASDVEEHPSYSEETKNELKQIIENRVTDYVSN